MENENKFTQLCVWEGVIMPPGSVEEITQFFKDEFDTRIKFAEQVLTLPGNGGEGGRSDLFFYVNSEDIGKFAVRRLAYQIRWWEDVLGNGNGNLYSQEIREKYKSTWSHCDDGF